MDIEKYFEEVCQIARDVLTQHKEKLGRVGLTASLPLVRSIEGFNEPELLIEFYKDGNLEDCIEQFALDNKVDPIPLDSWRVGLTSYVVDVIEQAQDRR